MAPIEWTENYIKALISNRLRREEEFKNGGRKAGTLWNNIINDIKIIHNEFPFEREACMIKYTNLFSSYRRIKGKQLKTGKRVTSWLYFQDFDMVYATNSNFILNLQKRNENTLPLAESSEITGEGNESLPSKRNKMSENFLQFIKEEAEKIEKRHNETIEVEKEKINLMKDMNKLLRDALNTRTNI